jgi:hypothetical protein|uniref:Uncharacterized protein n=2 Tax=Limosilactobacillus reuteri TaxID=1598 RepID=F8KE47_LIMR5|nr:hypothetical protein LRATCC53608_0522 [Limosilactobacillus reuteri subsp. suis]
MLMAECFFQPNYYLMAVVHFQIPDKLADLIRWRPDLSYAIAQLVG